MLVRLLPRESCLRPSSLVVKVDRIGADNTFLVYLSIYFYWTWSEVDINRMRFQRMISLDIENGSESD